MCSLNEKVNDEVRDFCNVIVGDISMPRTVTRNKTDLASLLLLPYMFVPTQLSPLEVRLHVEQNRHSGMVGASPTSKGAQRYKDSPRRPYWVDT